MSSTDLRDGEVHYLDVTGRETNTAGYSGTAAAGWHLGTTEYGPTGNVLRSLSAADREEALSPTTGAGAALGLPADTAAAALALSTVNLYATGADGVADLTDTYGPYHTVVLPGGSQAGARAHTHTTYDTGTETGHPSGGTLHLATSTTTAASLSTDTVATNEQDPRRTDTTYALSAGDATGWTFRTPMKTIEDPTGLARTSITRYDAATGATVESRMPSNTAGGGAGTTLTVYYTPGTNAQDAACGNKPAWANLACETTPAAQPGVAGLPGLVTTRTTSYDYLNRSVGVDETVTDAGGTPRTRTTTTGYLNSGYGDRVASQATTGGLGAALPSKTTTYDPNTGAATTVSAAATTENPATSATTGYDDFGRTVSYVDADEATGAARNAVTTSYDTAGRVHQTTDAHTTLTYTYNSTTEHRGQPTALAVAVNSTTPYSGTFTAGYDPDGQLLTQTDPAGIAQTLTRDEVGQLRALTDIRTADGSTWLTDQTTTTIHGQQQTETGLVGAHTYTYDPVGRLTAADDTPAAGTCTHRTYAFDADTNRTSGTAYPPAADGTCQGSTGGVATSHTYDAADRLQPSGPDTGLTYDAFGRVTTNPGTGGGPATTIGYYTSDLVRSQTQGTTTRAWTLDAATRLRTWTDTVSGTPTATHTNHYDDPSSDSPDWIAETADSSQWTTNIQDLTGSLGLTVAQDGTAAYQYANLHGDICATAPAGATTPTPAADYDEYGNPTTTATTPRYGWLGAKQRPTDNLTNLILMGVRLYNPATGRFLQTDPVPGGSANPYDYAGADPINTFDLDGKCWQVWRANCRQADSWTNRVAGASRAGGRWTWHHKWDIAAFAPVGGEFVWGYRAFRAYRAWTTVRRVRGGMRYDGPKWGISARYDRAPHRFNGRLFRGRYSHLQIDIWRHGVKGSGHSYRLPIWRRGF